MESFKNNNSRLLILFVTMAVLLPLLAALQYHWLGQVSEAASERLQSGLRASATAFRRDFNRELIRAYMNFHMESTAPPDDVERFHLARLENWNQTAPHPQIISQVFVFDHDELSRPRLSRVNLQTKKLEATDWSGELANLRERISPGDSELNAGATRQSLLDSFAEDIPALIVPFPGLMPPPANASGSDTPASPGVTIIKLDLSYLQREFIPALARRHSLDSSTEYDLAITSLSDPARVIYSSREPMPDFSVSDASTQIFGMEADELEAFLRSDGAEQVTATESSGRPSRLVKLRLLKRIAPSPVDLSSHLQGRWQLSVKHRAGSLAAAVSSVRRRNLAISFGILLLLGVGILMTAVSTRRAQRLAQQQLGFVAGVTHELRTPLAVICSAGENLEHGIVDTPEKAAQYGQVIRREGRRLTEMIERVLEFGGAQSGKQRYDFRPIDLAAIIENAVAASQSQIREKNFQLETSITPNLPQVKGDSAALRRALQNLISNAMKYDGKRRWARVSAEQSPDTPNEIQVAVADRGMGIEAEDIPHIFEPFYRGREAVAAQIEGSGVGLSIVKQIVEAHGGSIEVKSTPGVGSTFTFRLPVASERMNGEGARA